MRHGHTWQEDTRHLLVSLAHHHHQAMGTYRMSHHGDSNQVIQELSQVAEAVRTLVKHAH